VKLSADKDVRVFCDLVVATGKVSLAPGGKHIRLFWRDSGRPVMDGADCVSIATSPSAPGWRDAATRQLVRVGVFERSQQGRRRRPYRVLPLAERARELMLDPRPARARVTAVCREIAQLEHRF
jgi:hypothetical protein